MKNRYDLVWCCHVLEHQLNVNYFLRKIRKVLMPNGILALTVPPAKSQIVGGHLSVWNAGLLLYNLVLAGFDCRDAHVLKYGYNISIVLANKKIKEKLDLKYDAGDISIIKKYLPDCIEYVKTEHDFSFCGNIDRINW